MKTGNPLHLTYCTNIHPGESWEDVFGSLQQYALPLKNEVSPGATMGIGLRLSDTASRTLTHTEGWRDLKTWLNEHGLYVAILNGFPFGGFHRQRVKDDVHRPDWTTHDRQTYTVRLAAILSQLVPEGISGGISTSPITYRPWWQPDQREAVLDAACDNLARTVAALANIRRETGKFIHLDIEPEPDGLLDTTANTIHFFTRELPSRAGKALVEHHGFSAADAETVLRDHIQLCYDVCHFAVMFEDPKASIRRLMEAGIRIGRVQLSAALKASIPADPSAREALATELRPFADSTYLHQVAARQPDGSLQQFPDLAPALATIGTTAATEWRSHFHVPLFVHDYGRLQSTQSEIVQTLELVRQQPVTEHLEVETYTWEVLPPALKLDLHSSIRRELEWVQVQLGTTKG
jgi:sugar phosphate isomerase/epimerase